jgi:hypothetical protein
LIDLLKRPAVCIIARGVIAQGGRDVDFLRHLVEPPLLVATRKPDKRSPLGELIKPGSGDRQA